MENSDQSSFRTPDPSRAARKISPRSRASMRGQLIAKLPAHNHNRRIVFESKLERDVLHLLLARNDVHDIWDQPPSVSYRGYNGELRTHTFDYLVTKTNGERLAIAVKPAAKVISRNFRNELLQVRQAMPRFFADKIVLITDQSFTKADANNAMRLHQFQHHKDLEADCIIADILKTWTHECTIADIVSQSGLEGRAFRSVFKAIYQGIVRVLEPGEILPRTRIAIRLAT
jgi:hypothetical protein